MAKDPAVLFYTSDFLTGTMTMNNEQVGKYIRLLCLQHQRGMLSEKDMLNICGSYDDDIFSKFKKERGNYYNERMLIETERRKKYTQSRGENRRKGAENKQVGNNHMKITSKSYDKHMETENEIETITDNIIDYRLQDFEKFWEKMPNKVSKKKCLDKWKKLNGQQIDKILATIDAWIAYKPFETYTHPHPITYLNQERWNDELPKLQSVVIKTDIHKASNYYDYNGYLSECRRNGVEPIISEYDFYKTA